MRTSDEAFQFIFHNVSRIIFLKVSTVSYHCIPQIMPTALLNLQSAVQCSVIWREILNVIPRIFLYTTFMPCLCSPIFLTYSPWEISLYFSDTGAMILPLWNSSEIIPINLSSAVLWHCAYFNFYLFPSFSAIVVWCAYFLKSLTPVFRGGQK